LPSTRQIQRNSIVCFDHQDFFVRNGTNAIMVMVARMVKGQFESDGATKMKDLTERLNAARQRQGSYYFNGAGEGTGSRMGVSGTGEQSLLGRFIQNFGKTPE
jgi:hypothetical protein